jgi:hypothetical protein
MTLVLVVVLALALVAVVLALAREIRLRRALVRLLHQLLSRWRANDSKKTLSRRDNRARDHDMDEWL